MNRRKIITKNSNKKSEVINLSGTDKFIIETFFVLIDKLITDLKKRSETFEHITKLFGFLWKIMDIRDVELEVKVKSCVEVYLNDLQMNLFGELQQFIPLMKRQPKRFHFAKYEIITNTKSASIIPLRVLNWIVN